MIPVDQTIPYEEGAVVLGNCLQAAVASIYELPIEAVPHFVQFDASWGEALKLYVEAMGNDLLLLQGEPAGGETALAFGMSPRGVRHSVVWRDGTVIHDPHPSKAGLIGDPEEFWSITRRRAAERVAPVAMPVFHVQGFADERGVRGIHVMQHEGTVIEIARGVIETATSGGHTELVSFERTWPLDGVGQEWAVVEVDAVTRTTLDGGQTWSEMWHWFGTLSSPWPTSRPVQAEENVESENR